MKNFFRLFTALLICFLVTSCGASRKTSAVKGLNKTEARKRIQDPEKPQNRIRTGKKATLPEDKRIIKVTSYALEFEGTKYKYGGTDKKGMDCSGLVFTSFLSEDISLPRTSRGMSLEGERLKLNQVTIGDLLFFETDKNKKVVNHVGLVVDIQPGHILFIHSTTSRGVIISSLADNYWFNHFIMARRVI